MAVPTMTNNSPTLGSIAWGAFNIQYLGVSYAIPAGSTSQRWVWWRYNGGASVIEAGADIPLDLTDDDLVLFGNKGGTGVRIQSSTSIDGELIVDGSILAKALSVDAVTTDHLLAGDALIKGLLSVTETVALAVSTNGLYVGENISLDIESGLVVRTPLGDTVLPADGQAPVFTGSATFNALTVLGDLKIQGVTNEVAKGSILRLASGITAPKTSPAGSAYWPNKPTHEGFYPKGFAYHSGSAKYYQTESIGVGVITAVSETATQLGFHAQIPITGNTDNGMGAFNRSEVTSASGGIAIYGNNMYVLCYTDEAYSGTYYSKMYVYKATWNGSKWVYSTRWEYLPANFLGGKSQYEPAIGIDDATGDVVIVQCGDGGQAWVTTYNSSGTQLGRSSLNLADGTSYSPGRSFMACGYTSADFGAKNLYAVMRDDGAIRIFYGTNLRYAESESFVCPSGKPTGALWDPVRAIFRSREASKVYDHTNIRVATIAAVMTWRKANGTAPAYAQYETDKSRAWITTSFPKRAGLQLSAGTIPDDITDPNDPDSVTFYVAQNDTSGANTSYKRMATPAAGVTQVGITSLPTTGGNPPTAPNFPSSTPARLLSADGVIVDIRGSGQWRLGDISGTPDGRVQGGAFVPIGGAIPYFGTTPPVGWLLLNGGLCYESTYPLLFAHLVSMGFNAFGTSPNRYVYLPDSRDRFIGGAGTARALFAIGGADEVTMPDHTHYNGTLETSVYSHNRATNTTTTGSGVRIWDGNGNHSHNVTGQTGVVVSNPAVGNVPKHLIANYIIRAA